MVETTADVRRDIELTRDRISDTLQELEQRMNVAQVVRDHPWPALALAVGAGVLLSGTKADVKAAAATVVATQGARGRLGDVLDELVSHVVGSFQGAIEARIEGLANEVKRAIGAPIGGPRITHPTPLGHGVRGTGDASSGAPRAD
jgi:transcription elongation GreA/GreB family factor